MIVPQVFVFALYIFVCRRSPQEPQTFFTSKQYCYCNIWRRRRRKSLLASNFRLIHILCFISIAKWLLSIFFNCKFFCNVINSRLVFKFILKVTDSIRSCENKIFGLHSVLFLGYQPIDVSTQPQTAHTHSSSHISLDDSPICQTHYFVLAHILPTEHWVRVRQAAVPTICIAAHRDST